MRPRHLLTALALSLTLTSPASAQSAYEQLQMLTDALNLVRGNYVDSVAYTQLARAAINGILRSLDPHSYFISASDYSLRTGLEAGQHTTVGMTLTEVEGRITVLAVRPRGPAERGGIHAGDRLLAVNDMPTAGSRAALVELILSSPDRERRTLLLERGARLNPDTFRITVRTEEQRDVSVTDTRVLADGTGYLRLVQFGPKAADELQAALRQLRPQATRGMIIDLRNNPGGLVVAAADIASLFVPKGTLVFRTDGRKADADEEYTAERNGPFQDTPLVLLVDAGTASASEALAAALQDHRRATIVGRRTFGKALVQAPFFMKTGDVMWLTIARVYSPAGRMIQRDYRALAPEAYRTRTASDSTRGGVLPDVEVPVAELPSWWARAGASGVLHAVADSVAATLAESADARTAWRDNPADWQSRLLPPLLAKLPHAAATEPLTDAMKAAAARALAARVAEVRWGADAAIELQLMADPDIVAGVNALGRT